MNSRHGDPWRMGAVFWGKFRVLLQLWSLAQNSGVADMVIKLRGARTG
jgi:hypothetical protein